ncbi:hypothetical protein [Sanguibacter sp. Leaf3]|uniref:hypothetical protein n=1 Tax=Sanguibacter sp. Leaf3 TaxID=1736209 RepID=UPI0006F6A069|nr:hypothetical protein [Sanguibacter sp. Leaf3]KQT98369.1 hypothetical protein ASG53_11960 [Sanguibacter sp. Leaf3]
MPQHLAWLPDHHLPVAATLAHSEELIDHLSALVLRYGETRGDDGPLDLIEVPVDGRSETRISGIRPVPRAIALYAADALTTLRAAIEHTLYAEVEYQLGRKMRDREPGSISMPASDTLGDFADWEKKGAKRMPAPILPGSVLHQRIQSLQPYQRYAAPEAHPLHRLAAYTNLSKHRSPTVAAVRVPLVRPDSPSDAITLAPPSEEPAQVGDVLAWTLLGHQVPASIYATLAIQHPTTGAWPVLVHEVSDLATWVRNIAIPTLIAGSKQSNLLPATFDTSVGHIDEREALRGGGYATARERANERVQAYMARPSLVGLLSEHKDSPPMPVLIEWARSLTDQQALDRSRAVEQFADTYDPGIAALVESFQAEAIAVVRKASKDSRLAGEVNEPAEGDHVDEKAGR